MYCTNCGAPRPDGATVCPSCGSSIQSFATPPAINNYLVPAILVTLCCCMPVGIVAIIFAAQVNSKLAAGDVAGAQKSARLARIWSWVGVALGLAGGAIYALLTVSGVFGGHS
jgi:hypothetical protein